MTPIKACLLAFCICLPHAALAAPKVYAGSEAQAIRCAQLVFWVASEGGKLGYISSNDQQGIRAYGLYVLSRYTTGSPAQKARALTQMTKATQDAISRQKFIQTHRRCTRQFPFSVN